MSNVLLLVNHYNPTIIDSSNTFCWLGVPVLGDIDGGMFVCVLKLAPTTLHYS